MRYLSLVIQSARTSAPWRKCRTSFSHLLTCRTASNSSIPNILAAFKNGKVDAEEAESRILSSMTSLSHTSNSTEETLRYFANIDHSRSFRTGFPEVVFAETKTPKQVAMILDDMARHVNELVDRTEMDAQLPESTTILATR